ncbi:MAG: hypothetical protein H7Y07_16090 [Pyrinomonadaceae bacterium]|nr:hypothetical protein [Sphingobacteriaceae bacterium]
MKSALLKISFVLLILCFMGAGCDKDKIDFNTHSIIGQWKWEYTLGGFVGTTYPEEGKTVILEFTKDSMLIERENGKITFETQFKVDGDTLKYDRGIDLEYKIKISNDTLALTFIEFGLNPFYKRIN